MLFFVVVPLGSPSRTHFTEFQLTLQIYGTNVSVLFHQPGKYEILHSVWKKEIKLKTLGNHLCPGDIKLTNMYVTFNHRQHDLHNNLCASLR